MSLAQQKENLLQVQLSKQEEELKHCLKLSNNYVARIIFANHGGSTFLITLITAIVPVYLHFYLNASPSVVGIVYSVSKVGTIIRILCLPHLSKYICNGTHATIRIFVCIPLIVLFANLKSINGFVICFILVRFCGISEATSFNCVSILVPDKHAKKYSQSIVIIGVLVTIFANIVSSAILAVTSFANLFYISSAGFCLLFIFNLFCILRKEEKLIAKQMLFFNERFYVEKKKREIENHSNKYRRKSSVAMSVEQYLQQNGVIEQRNINNGIDFDFPIYEVKAREIVFSHDILIANSQAPNANTVLNHAEWRLVVFAMMVKSFFNFAVGVQTGFMLLYLVTKFPSQDTSLCMLMTVMFVIAILISVILYPLQLKMVKCILFGWQSRRCNIKQEMVANISLLVLSSLLPCIAVCLWLYVFNYFHFGWVALFVSGFGFGLFDFISNIIIVLLKAEHLQSKLIGTMYAIGALSCALGTLVMGFLWDLSIDWVLYSNGLCAFANAIAAILILIILAVTKW